MLVAGSPFKEWAAGKATSRKIAVSGDFASLVTLGSRGVKTRLALNSLLRCDLGRGAAHAKRKMLVHESSRRQGGRRFVIKGRANGERRLVRRVQQPRRRRRPEGRAQRRIAVRSAMAAPDERASGSQQRGKAGSWCGRGCPSATMIVISSVSARSKNSFVRDPFVSTMKPRRSLGVACSSSRRSLGRVARAFVGVARVTARGASGAYGRRLAEQARHLGLGVMRPAS